jgi:uncharacterized protein (UPF0332 family)
VFDIVPKSHNALKRLFGKYLIQTGELETEWADILSRELRYRINADYMIDFEISEETAESLVHDAERFVERMKAYLWSKGISLPDEFQK